MDGAIITTLIVGVLSSGALVALVNNLFQRKRDIERDKESKATGAEAKIDTIVEKVDAIVADQDKIMKAQHRHEMDILRVELKLMISDLPDQESDILRIGEHYCTDGGNWVMSSTFLAWLQQRNLPTPPWFRNE